MQNDQARPTDKAVRLTKANKDDEPDVNEMFGDKNGVPTFEGPPIERLDNKLGAADTPAPKPPESKPITPETPKPPETPETSKGDYDAPNPPEPVNEAVADAQSNPADVELTDYVTPEQQTQWETEHGGDPQPAPEPEPAPEPQPERGGSDRERRQREAEARAKRDEEREQRRKEAEGEEADPQEIEGENASEDTNALGGPEETTEDDDTDSKGTALGSTPPTGAAADRADEEVRRMQAEKRWRSTKDALVTIAAMMPGEALNATGKGLNSINSLVDGFLSGKMMSQGSRIVADSLAMADTVNQSAKRIHERYGILRDADPEIVRQTYKGRMMQARSEAEMKGIARAHLFVEDRLSGRDIENLTMDDLDSLDADMTGDIARLKAEFARDRADRQNGGKGTMTKEERASGLAQLHSYDDVLKEMKKQRSSLRADELEQKRRTKERTAAQAQADYDNGTDDQRAIWDIVGKGVELDPDTGMPADGRFLSKIEGQLKAAQLRDPQNPMWERLLSQNKAYRQKLARNPNTGTDAGGRVALNAIVTESRRNMADILRNQGLDPDAVFADPQKLMAQIRASDEFREQYNRYAMNSNDLDMRDLTGLASQYSRSDLVMATMMNRITARAAQLQKDEAQARMAGAVIGEDSVFKQYVQYVNTFFGPSTARVRKGMDTRMNKLADDLEAEFAVTKDPAVKKEADELRDRAMLLMDSFDPQTQDPAQARQDYLVGLADASMRIHDAKEGLDRRASIRKEDERRAIEQQREQIRMAREYNRAQEKARRDAQRQDEAYQRLQIQRARQMYRKMGLTLEAREKAEKLAQKIEADRQAEEQKRQEAEAKAEEERFNSVKDEKIKGMQDQKDAAAAEAQKEIDRRAGRWTEKEYDARRNEIDEILTSRNIDAKTRARLINEKVDCVNGAWIARGLSKTGFLSKKIGARIPEEAQWKVREKLDKQLKDLYQRDIEDREAGRTSENFDNAKKYLQILTSPKADAVWRDLKVAQRNMDKAGLPKDDRRYEHNLRLQAFFSDFSLDDFFEDGTVDPDEFDSKGSEARTLRDLRFKDKGDDSDKVVNVDAAKRRSQILGAMKEAEAEAREPTGELQPAAEESAKAEELQPEPEDVPNGRKTFIPTPENLTDSEKKWYNSDWHNTAEGKIKDIYNKNNKGANIDRVAKAFLKFATSPDSTQEDREKGLRFLEMLSYYNSFNKKGLVISDDASPTLRAYHKYQEMKAKDPNDPNLMEYLKNPDFVPKSEVKQPAPEDKAKESSKVQPKAKKKIEPIDTSKVGNSFWSSKGLPKGTDPNSKQAWMWAVELRNNWPDLYEHPENTTNSIAKPLFEQARDIIEGKDSYGNLSDEEKDAIDAEEAKGIKDRQKQAAQAKKKKEETKKKIIEQRAAPKPKLRQKVNENAGEYKFDARKMGQEGEGETKTPETPASGRPTKKTSGKNFAIDYADYADQVVKDLSNPNRGQLIKDAVADLEKQVKTAKGDDRSSLEETLARLRTFVPANVVVPKTPKKEEEAKPQPTPSDVVTERPSREAAGDDYVGQYNKYLDYLDTAEKTDKMVDDILDTRDDLEDRINDSKNPEEKEALKKLFARARNISIF